MPFRLSLRYKNLEFVATNDATDDPVVAIFNCRQLQEKVLPIVKQQIPFFKRATPSDIERRIDRIVDQLPLGPPIMNGKH